MKLIIYIKQMLIFIFFICFSYVFTITVFAKTETIEIPTTENINLIEIATKLHENYHVENDKYFFSFNGSTLSLSKDNTLLKVNNKLIPIQTEVKNGITLPKYQPLNISENSIEMNCKKFLEMTGYKTTDNGIELTMEDDYKIPTTKEIKNTDISYISKKLSTLGYIETNGFYQYLINNTEYQQISTSDKSMIITTMIGEEYKDNQTTMNLLIEEIFKSLDQENYKDLYQAYLNKDTSEKKTDNITVNMSFSNSESQVKIEQK